MAERLAILGGDRIRQREWPKWPRATAATERAVCDVLQSGRWTLSGAYAGEVSRERQFATAYAAYHEVPYCTPTTSGTAALTLALLALGVGPGDEVLVPGLTWVACASSVLAIGAVPILVDIDAENLAMSPEAARAAITARTRAILLVHPFCTVAAIDEFLIISREAGVPLVEDCAQAHGACWNGQRVGTFGDIGCFSMQQSKVLTCGEGGAAITRSHKLYERMEQIRCDSRMYSTAPSRVGRLELMEIGEVQGRNLALSEIQSAILLDRLPHLDAENAYRSARGEVLAGLLKGMEGVALLEPPAQLTARTYYNLVIRIDPEVFANQPIGMIARALADELDTNVNPIYRPMNRHPLYRPMNAPRGDLPDAEWKRRDSARFVTPVAEQCHATCLTLTHPVLLDDDAGMADIAKALTKVRALAADLGDVVISKTDALQSF